MDYCCHCGNNFDKKWAKIVTLPVTPYYYMKKVKKNKESNRGVTNWVTVK